MNPRATLKSAAPYVAHYSGLSRTLAVRYAGAGVIFGLHSISDNAASGPDEYLGCPERALEQTLSWLRNNNIAVVSLDEAMRRLDRPSAARFCVFTFDDGYADNFTRALPIMERFAAPFTVYVTAGMLTGEIDAWWLGLAALIRGRDDVELPELDCRVHCSDHTNKKRAFATIRTLITANPQALAAVRRAIGAAGIDCSALARAEGLTAEQLRLLAASPLVTIGAHTVRHINFASASAADVREEMASGRDFLEDILQREVTHFAYPFGAGGPREAELAHAVGFRTAVTTKRGSLFAAHLRHPYALPREAISRYDTPSTLRCKIDGVYRAFQSRLGDPVALL
jgi:peptidoglycan/xylan/chitin deacetylase (PgdA/CDA1 family)